MQVEDPRSGISFPTIVSEASGLADTYIIAHYDGDGASTLALFLSLFMQTDPVVMEIGTNASRAFKSLPEDSVFRPPAGTQYPARIAMDERLRHPSKPAILEFGRTHWRDAIDIAAQLQRPPFSAASHFCFVASENDRELKVPELAHQKGVHNIVTFGGHKIAQETRLNVIKIPTLPDSMQRLVYNDGLSLRDAVDASEDRFSVMQFIAELHVFGDDLWFRLTI
jgi:hypothetical protein